MIEKVIFDYLNRELSVPALLEAPEGVVPESYVIIEKTGSSRNEHINHAMMTFKSYAPSMFKAAQLNENVKTAMDEAAILPEITSSRLNSDYNYTNTTTKAYRYQAVYDIWHY